MNPIEPDTDCDEMKAQLAGNEAVTSEAAGSAFVENFALRVFLAADNADRAGDVGKCVSYSW